MRLRLFVLGGRDVGRSFEVESGSVLGRAVECEVRLGDRSISRRHARVVLRDGTWSVEDLGSRNGLFLGRSRVRELELHDHLEFRVGELPFRVRLGDVDVGVASPWEQAPAPRAEDAALGVEEEEIHLDPDPAETSAPLGAAAPASRESERERRRGEILRGANRARGWSGDLAQRPPWMRAVLVALVVVVAAFVFLLAFRSVQLLRGGP